MTESEDQLRAAFEADFAETPARPGLRERALRRAFDDQEPAPARGRWFSPARLAPALVAMVVVFAGVAYIARPTSPGTGPAKPHPSALVAAQFGKLPAPALTLPQGVGAGNSPGQVYPYFGPATLTWTGKLPDIPATAPVYRFPLTDVALNGFIGTLRGSPAPAPKGPAGAEYQLPGGLRITAGLPDPQHGVTASRFQLNVPRDVGGAPSTDTAARADAEQFLRSVGLFPAWPSNVLVLHAAAPGNHVILPDQVLYQRIFNIPGGLAVPAVNGQGDPDGIQVAVDARGAAGVLGQVPLLPETPSDYLLVHGDTVVRQALAAPPADRLSLDGTPAGPAVKLTNASLVYVPVASGDSGYYEPAYLFTGLFDSHGATYEKRVVVPALTPAELQ